MRNNDEFFDFCGKERTHECEREDFDFCEDDCDFEFERRRDFERGFGRDGFDFLEPTRIFGRGHECEREHERDRECKCEYEREKDDCDHEKDRDKECCEHDRDRDRERCRNFGYGDCCEEQVHCSNFRDFNEDERFGCNVRCDAAQSDDSWFECRENDCCMKCREMCEEEKGFCKKLKCRIQVLDFILQETILFLDTHPCDYEALRYYRIVRRKLARLERLYECKCGPLTAKGVDTEFGWEWACCPWPWEGKD